MSHLESGGRIGDRFLLQERIGDGGHAEIWAAWDAAREQRVALKFLHADVCGAEEAWAVLRHESQMVQQLDHPGVLRTEDPQRAGRHVFLPMEYAAGGDLKGLRSASYLESVPVLIKVAMILAHAHERGIVHRDIKPGNVLFDSAGEVRLADFGASAVCGSPLSLAAGSPFTASPQQLRGEAASPSDDVYGLGALSYELLSGYPPYYPDFDPHRVQTQMPPAVRPTHPVPPRLTRLVMSMLAREPQGRPRDMRAVIDELQRALEDTLSIEETGTSLIVEAVAPTASSPAQRPQKSSRPAVVAGGVAAAIALVSLLVMQRPDRNPGLTPELQPVSDIGQALAPAADNALAQATREIDAAAQSTRRDFGREVEAGRLALSRAQPALARMAFERARVLNPQAPEVGAGLEAVKRLEQVLALHSDALRAEAAGQLALARDRFDAVLRVDPAFAPALEGRHRSTAQLQQRQSAANQREQLARSAAQNQRDERVGLELESAERWSDAVTLYQVVLERDYALDFARAGLRRSQERAALAQQLDEFMARPARLASPAVRAAAEQVLANGRSVQPAAPRLTQQLAQLSTLLASFDVEIQVEIISDNSTRVSIARVGDLGVFNSRELSLRPGRYTVIGTREGYRDVRRELQISPGQRLAPLAIECTERI